MKYVFTLALLALAPFAHADADALNFSCTCAESMCSEPKETITGSYNRATQFLKLDGKSWNISGYVARQISKATGSVYLTLPATYSFAPISIELKTDGETRGFYLSGLFYACTTIQP